MLTWRKFFASAIGCGMCMGLAAQSHAALTFNSALSKVTYIHDLNNDPVVSPGTNKTVEAPLSTDIPATAPGYKINNTATWPSSTSNSTGKAGVGHTETTNLATLTFASGSGVSQADPNQALGNAFSELRVANFDLWWDITSTPLTGAVGRFRLPVAVTVAAGGEAQVDVDVQWNATVGGTNLTNVRSAFKNNFIYTTSTTTTVTTADEFLKNAGANLTLNVGDKLNLKGSIIFRAENTSAPTSITVDGDLDNVIKALDPVVRWSFDETEVNKPLTDLAADSAPVNGGDNLGDYIGAPVARGGVLGNSMEIFGSKYTGSSAAGDSVLNASSFTAVVWANDVYGDDSGEEVLFSGGQGTKNGFSLRTYQGEGGTYLTPFLTDSTGGIFSFNDIYLGDLDPGFHMYALSFNGTTGLLEVYVDGVLKLTTTPDSFVRDASGKLVLYAGYDKISNEFASSIQLDEFLFFNKTLTSDNVQELYLAGKPLEPGTDFLVGAIVDNTLPVPEPVTATMSLMGLGALAAASMRRRR